MPNLIPLTLYTTSHCHLCEQALAILEPLAGVTLKLIDIAEDDALIAAYGTRIPVLQRMDNLHELNWPFDQHDVLSLMQV